MREYIDQNDVANAVMMVRSGFKGTVVLVEGNTDDRLFGKFLDRKNTRIVVAQSKCNVKSVLAKLKERLNDSIIGIVDADLDRALGKMDEPPLFRTDARDNEAMMFFSRAFDDLLDEYADRDSLGRFEDRYGDVRERIAEACYPLGVLMLISERNDIGLKFKELDFQSFIDRRSISCDVRRMVKEVISATRRYDVREGELLELIAKEKRYPIQWICRGHDLTEIIAIALKNAFGSYNTASVSSAVVAGGLRLAYDFDDFSQTELYRKTKEWMMSKGLSLWRS